MGHSVYEYPKDLVEFPMAEKVRSAIPLKEVSSSYLTTLRGN